MELDDSEGKGILEHQGTASGAEKTSSEQTLLPTETERVKQDRPTHSNDIERLVGEGHKEPLNSKLDSGAFPFCLVVNLHTAKISCQLTKSSIC